jgi:hypothetical protein
MILLCARSAADSVPRFNFSLVFWGIARASERAQRARGMAGAQGAKPLLPARRAGRLARVAPRMRIWSRALMRQSADWRRFALRTRPPRWLVLRSARVLNRAVGAILLLVTKRVTGQKMDNWNERN